MFNFWQKSGSESRQLIIGDVHGHYDGLMQLLQTIKLTDHDELYFLGDLIDRGPKSAEVVKFVRSGNYHCLMGNHEIMLLKAYNNGQIDDRGLGYWLQAGGDATLESYGEKGIPESDLLWMSNLPFYLDLGNYWLVHAGIDPYLNLDEQSSEQFCWIREKFFKADFAYFEDKIIITGHTITFTLPGLSSGEIALGDGWINIETGAYHKKSGWLTALDLTNQLVYQVNVFSKKQRKKPLEQISKVIDTQKIKE